MRADLVVVGGGPAGLATAIFAAQRGLSTVVVDKRRLPLDKACGEGLMPPGVAALEEMGVEVPAWGRTPLFGIRYLDRDVVAEAPFLSGPGLGVRRTALIEGMAARASELGAQLQYGCGAKSWRATADRRVVVETEQGAIEAGTLVGADGLLSRIRREAGLEQNWPGRRRFGVRRHFKIPPWSPFVEVHWSDHAEAYLTPVGPDQIGLALLWGGEGATFEQLLAHFPRLQRRLAGAPYEGKARGAGPFRQGVRRRYGPQLALVGDAAGYLDPITGEGLSLAFHCARALANTLASKRSLQTYEEAYRRLSRTYYLMTGALLRVAERPWLRRRVMATLARNPELFARLVAINSGEWPIRSLGWGGTMRLIEGIAMSHP